jgi:glycosyltransferase involved in cell wall biosynthesis
MNIKKMETGIPDISVVIPIFLNEPFIEELSSRLISTLERITAHFEIIMVDDCSPDNSWSIIKTLAEKEIRIRGLKFSKNFGQHKAVTAGIDRCRGKWVVVMDGDLQDRPEEIERLHEKAITDCCDIVFARRKRRKDHLFKRLSSKLFYMVLNKLSGSHIDSRVANFGIYSKKVIDNFKKMREQNRLFLLFIEWLGFEAEYIDVEHDERLSGKTAYSFYKRISLAVDAIISMSNRPLKMAVKFGFFIAFMAFIYGVFIIFRYFLMGTPVMGWTSLMVSVWFVGGLIFALLGILGLYVGRVFDEVKYRPLYVISEEVNRGEDNDRLYQ